MKSLEYYKELAKKNHQIHKEQENTDGKSDSRGSGESITKPVCLFLGTWEDKEYIPHLKGMFNGLKTFLTTESFSTLTQLELYCNRPDRNISYVVTTNTNILGKLLELRGNPKTSPKLSDYQGSLFKYKSLEIVFISPLKQIFTVDYGRFIASRFISKLVDKESWSEPTDFVWAMLTPGNINSIFNHFHTAQFMAVDIETFKKNLAIRCIGYTAVFIDSSTGAITSHSVVLPIDSDWALIWMRKFNQIPVSKIFQNGKYDCSYLLRYNAVPTNWLGDTAHFFHAWYSELPKDLAFLNAFFLREVVYWKDLAETNDLEEYYRYNAMDTWATANVWIQQIRGAPTWVVRNFLLAFPLVFPCLLAELTGLKRDQEKLLAARKLVDDEEEKALSSLRAMINVPDFNPGSWQQVLKLIHCLGCTDITSTGEIELDKVKLRHPINGVIVEKILTIRGLRKLATTYLRLDSDGKIKKSTGELENGSKDFHGRIIYSKNPHGTETGRLASTEHSFWCGLQIHNIPRGEPGEPSHTKTTLCAEDGFNLGECDLEQAESRDTGYIAGETTLIDAVTGTRDFHSVNASAFFGISYDDLYDDTAKKSKNKPVRDTSKRTNHGANYNMGALVLVNTMRLDKVWDAQKLLKLPGNWVPTEVTEYLLTKFHITYSGLRGPIAIKSERVRQYTGLPECRNKLYAPGTYYAAIAYEISTTRRIVSRAFHHTEYNLKHYEATEYINEGDWTRSCFGRPDVNKLDLNSYAAHPSQSLNARTLNEAFMRVFYEIALVNPTDFRLHAQIHDSIFFSYRKGRDDLPLKVKECMEIPVTVRDVHQITRTFTVPAALKLGKKDKATGEFMYAKYWNDTE